MRSKRPPERLFFRQTGGFSSLLNAAAVLRKGSRLQQAHPQNQRSGRLRSLDEARKELKSASMQEAVQPHPGATPPLFLVQRRDIRSGRNCAHIAPPHPLVCAFDLLTAGIVLIFCPTDNASIFCPRKRRD